MELILLITVPPIAYVLWFVVVPRIARQLEHRDLMDDLRPAAWEVAAAERDLPEVRDGWHLEPARLTRPGDPS